MKRIDDLIQAATYRFRPDLELQAEIARELRAHLEDAFDAARAEGMEEAQAEEQAARAFGDPEEVGEKLWQANLRRVRVRAIVRSAIGLALASVAFLSAGWFLSRRIGTGDTILCFLVLGIAYLGSRRFLPKTARFGFAFVRWLPNAFVKSGMVAFGSPWLWVPPLIFVTVGILGGVYGNWRASKMEAPGLSQPVLFKQDQKHPPVIVQHDEFSLDSNTILPNATHDFSPDALLRRAISKLPAVRPMMPRGFGWMILFAGYVLFARRIGRSL